MKWKLGLGRGLWGLGFPKIRGTILAVPIIRIIVFGGSILGPPILGNCHMGLGLSWAIVLESLTAI